MKDNIESKQNPTLFTRIIVTYDYHQATRKKKHEANLSRRIVPNRVVKKGGQSSRNRKCNSRRRIFFLSLTTHGYQNKITLTHSHSHRIIRNSLA